MTQRIDWKAPAPQGYTAPLGLESYVRRSGLEHSLPEPVKTRASPIKCCAD